MTNKIPKPSMNLANLSDMIGTIRLVLNKFLAGVDDMLPAQVISYDRVKNIARVQPLIVMVTTEDVQVKRAEIAAIPVLQLGGGGYTLSFPLAAGDLGWIKANDRDISLFKQSHKSAPPNTQRKHSFSDALFIPDVMMQGVTLADSGGVCLQSLDGSVSVVLVGNKVKVTAPNVEVTAGTNITLTAASKIIMNSPEIDFNSTNISANGIRFDTHEHTGVQTGPSKTGYPTNP